MAITVISRPLGHKLDTTDHQAVIVDDGTGDARVYTSTAHGLSDGDYVYIESNFDRYNGYKYVDSTAYDYFKIRNNAEDGFIEYIQDADIIFYISVLDHGWQCVHLPIVYELESDTYPVNVVEETYVPITIVSAANNNGNTQLNLSSALNSDVDALEWIELVGAGILAGPYQIITVLQPWSVVINLAWDATNDFTGYTVVNYYNNYFINVQVYAGLNASHGWVAEKPYEIAGTLKLIPDENNRVKFSISEILKGYIETRNNLTLDTLPNNLDFYVQFYIRYNQNHDHSDGTTITISEGDYTSDQLEFEGHAVNAMLPFKSQNAGHLSEYVNEDTHLSKWLTLQDVPLMIIGRFFDLSFLMTLNSVDVIVTIFKSANGLVTETEVITIENPGTGVIRVPITPESGFDQYCLQASTPGSPEVPGTTSSISLPARSTWLNIAGSGADWTTGILSPTVVPTGIPKTSDILAGLYTFTEGYTYALSYTLTSDQDWDPTILLLYVLDSSNNILLTKTVFMSGVAGSRTEIHTFVAPVGAVKMGIKLSQNFDAPATTFTFTQITGTQTTISIPATPAVTLTEQICCNVAEECNTFINDDLRILEGGEYRELE